MDLETKQEIEELPPQAPPSIEQLLGSILTELKEQRKDINAIKADQDALQTNLAQGTLVGPSVRHSADPNTPAVGHDQYARRTTLVTRPVQDNPQDYEHLVNTTDLRIP